MLFLWTEPFKKDFKRLPENLKTKIPVILARFSENHHYPSLQVKKMEGRQDIWEMRVNDSYRMTFQFVKEGTLLRRVGTHDILRTP